MKRAIRLLLLAGYLGVQFGESDLHAGEFVGATEWTQIANNMELGNITMQTLQQIAEQVKQTTMLVQQAKNLDVTLYSDVFGDIKAVEDIVKAGQGLAYSMGNLDSEWNVRFHEAGYTDTHNYPQAYNTWAKTSMDSIRGTMNAVTTQGSKFQSDADMVRKLQQQAQSGVAGSLQAEQMLNQMVAQLLGEMQKLRQLMLSDLSSKEAFQAQQIQEGMAAHDMSDPRKFFGTYDPDHLDYDKQTFPDENTSKWFPQ